MDSGSHVISVSQYLAIQRSITCPIADFTLPTNMFRQYFTSHNVYNFISYFDYIDHEDQPISCPDIRESQDCIPADRAYSHIL